jgi:putative endonuclease
MVKGGSVYIMTNKLRTTLYIGVTSDLYHRILQHKEHTFENSFTDKYNLEICVFYENFFSIEEAILREKQIKKWRREKKEMLINSINPHWTDLWNEIKTW